VNYTDLASHVTDRLVTRIEAGAGTWSMPWHTNPGLLDVRNAATGLPYRTGALRVFERAESGRWDRPAQVWAARCRALTSSSSVGLPWVPCSLG